MTIFNLISSYCKYLKNRTPPILALFTCFARGPKNRVIAFKILTPIGTDQDDVELYGKEFLKSIGEGQAVFTYKECQFSRRIIDATHKEVRNVATHGYTIIKVSGCGGS